MRVLVLACIVAANGMMGCATSEMYTPDTLYMPQMSDSIVPYFVNGQPLTEINTNTYSVLLSLEPVVVAGVTYMRLWVLYENHSDESVLFEPLKFATLYSEGPSRNVSSSLPESPTKLLAKISIEESAKQIAQVIGSALLSAQEQSALSNDADKAQARYRVEDRTMQGVANTRSWYECYRSSIDSGIMRRNTVIPSQSINGYIYFPLAWVLHSGARSDFGSAIDGQDATTGSKYRVSKRYRHKLVLNLNGVETSVIYEPIAGE